MQLHHSKHHQTYITNLNAAESTISDLSSQPQTPATVAQLIALQPAVKFNGGGHINHSLFWKNLAPAGSEESKVVSGGKFEELVNKDFGGLDGLKKEVNAKTAGIQGSGWGWVVRCVLPSFVSSRPVRLHVTLTDNLLMPTSHRPTTSNPSVSKSSPPRTKTPSSPLTSPSSESISGNTRKSSF